MATVKKTALELQADEFLKRALPKREVRNLINLKPIVPRSRASRVDPTVENDGGQLETDDDMDSVGEFFAEH